jgi:hypothetical protein
MSDTLPLGKSLGSSRLFTAVNSFPAFGESDGVLKLQEASTGM